MEDYSETGWKKVFRNLLKGVGYLSIFPRPYSSRNKLDSGNDLTPEQKDAAALSSDWRKVGKDLEDAFEKFRSENLLN